MRLDHLNLTRYGRFTDSQINFPAPAAEGPDLHIVFGPNEAGKSTLFSAWLDLLFGIPTQTRYSFLHAGPTMEIGAKIRHAGGAVEVVRRKGRGTTLSDRAGNALPDSTLTAALGGLTRDGYSAMFSLDDETIEQGGESILSSGGELGQLLFSASAGLSGLTRQLDDLRDGLDGFHRKGKRSGTLYEGKKRLEELAKTARALETTAAEQKRRSRELDSAQKDWRAAKAREGATRRALEEVQAALNALPLERMLAEAKTRLAELGALPDAGKAETTELAGLERDKARLDERRAALLRNAADLEEKLRHLTADPVALAEAEAILAAEALRAEHDSALKDLPRRRQELAERAQAIAALLADLGKPGANPADLILPPGLPAQIRGLLNQRSGLMQAAASAADEARKAAKHLETERARLGDIGAIGEGETGARLAALLSRIEASDPAQKRRLGLRERDEAAVKLQAALDGLAPWRGDADQLAALPVPAQWQVDNWRGLLEKTRQDEADSLRDLRHQEDGLAALRSALDGDENAPLGLNLADAAEARARREALWASHLATLSPASAQAFEAALRADDQFTALMGDAIARRQRIEEAQAELRAGTLALSQTKARHGHAVAARQELKTTIEASCDSLGLAGAGFPDLERWLSLRIEALRLRDIFRAAQATLSRAEDELAQAASSLARALDKTPSAAADAFDLLLAEAQALHRSAEKRQEARTHLNRLRSDAQERDEDNSRAQDEFAAWQAAWDGACAGSVLAALPRDSARAADLLDLLDDLAGQARDEAGLAHRVRAMEQNRDQFIAAKAAILAALDLPETALWTEALTRRDRAFATEIERQKLQDQRTGLQEDLRQTDSDLAAQKATLDGLAARMGWSEATGGTLLERIEACIEATRLRAEIARLSGELQSRPAPDEATPDEPAPDEATLRGRASQLAISVEEERQETERLQGLASDAQHALDQIGSDDALARNLAERENLGLSLKEQARDHLSRRFGLIALEIALRRYRDSHQSAMLAQASHAFERLSRGAYPSLSVVTQGNSDRLVAAGRRGATRMAADMSKGTRFQLYLALRIAGYHELAKTRAAVPFIADDIMETFDDDRAAAAFSLLGEMSRTGQVIYLTHHRHLCDIAQAACPGARVIDLQSL